MGQLSRATLEMGTVGLSTWMSIGTLTMFAAAPFLGLRGVVDQVTEVERPGDAADGRSDSLKQRDAQGRRGGQVFGYQSP